MKACDGCFRDRGPIPLSTDSAALGQCDFCRRHGVQVWNVAQWGDHVARVLDMYQASGSDEARAIHERFAEDWQIFTFNDPELVHQFLQASLGGPGNYALLDARDAVVPRYANDGVAANHKRRWEEFRDALITQNRYFPDVDFELQYLRDLVNANLGKLAPGMSLFRARAVAMGTRLTPDHMGVPPAKLVSGGRGNPVGIAHLYLANDTETCMRECRAQFNGDVAVATFELVEETTYLDLADLKPANPFLLGDDEGAGSANPLIRSLVATQFLMELGRELSVPTRPGENPLEYVPTQYLSEFVKSLGVGGIRYRSSLRPEGWNIVLFDPARARQVHDVQHFHVTDLRLTFEPA